MAGGANSPGLRKKLETLASAPLDAEARARLARGVRRETARVRRRLVGRFAPVRVDLPHAPIPTGPIARPDVVAAVILDPFSEIAFRFEWDQLVISKPTWRDELTRRRPDLLFVESAWRGNGGGWNSAMTAEGGPSEALRELVAWCRGEGIPTVFWNKEDPPNYDRFIETAKLFDQVFTVDADKLPAYVIDLGHDRVGLLPFGAQPRIHNPIRRDKAGADRPYNVAFAGTYFAEKHPERREQMDYVLGPARSLGLHIYSRMQVEDSRYRFPSEYRANIVGSLPYEKMLAAYSCYKVFLNVNSVTTSPTMCARRLFELSAAQTAVVTAPAASLAAFFGDDITVVHNAEEATTRLGNLVTHRDLRDRIALRAHRRVFDAHLYGHRVDQVLESIGHEVHPMDRSVSIIVPTMRPENLDNVWEFTARQAHPDVELVLVSHGFTPDPNLIAELNERHGLSNVTVRTAEESLLLGQLMNLGVDASAGRYVAKMDDDNYYGEHYLTDLVRAFDYTDAQVVGKWAHYVHIGDATGPTLLRFADSESRYVRLVQGGTIVTPRDLAVRLRFEDLPRRVDTTFLEKVRAQGGRVYSADRYNFVSTRKADVGGHTWSISTDDILARASELVFYGDATNHVTV
ncbi:MAG TPA: glycosyltransferase [Propionibacteriaceae bacterium]|nr:glycosyltransferase [Propionibacteriaceae bacterium]